MNIKAYVWDDKYHGESHVVWAATPGKAKALLAAEHGGLINMEIVKEYQQKNF